MLKGLTVVATSSTFKTQGHLDSVGALFVAEAGFADAMNELEKDRDWVAGFYEKRMTDAPGQYTVVFNTSGLNFKPWESVNNLASQEDPAPSYYGDVPPQSALIVVRARYQGTDRMILGVLGGGSAVPLFPGFVSSGKVALRGPATVDGIESLATGTAVDTGIYSRSSATGEKLVTWEPLAPTDRAVVLGEVGVASSDATAMDFGPDPNAYQVDAFKTGVTNLNNPVPDISAEIAAHSSAPTPSIQPLGTTTLSAGDYYYDGDVSIDGDLELNGATLYVSGELRVNGTIKGDGGVYVGKNTSFYGDAYLAGDSQHAVALYSKGNVKLQGFNGTEFINNAVAGDPQAQLWWNQTRSTMQGMQTLFETTNDYSDLMGDHGNSPPPGDTLEHMRWTLSDYSAIGGSETWNGYETDLLGKLSAYMQTQPPSRARDFILSRFDQLERFNGIDLNHPGNPPGTSKQAIVNNWLTGDRSYYGIIDAAASHGNLDLMGELATLVDQFSYDKLGEAYFRGVIYTNGFLYAGNEIRILGAVYAHDDGTQQPETVAGKDLAPGDLFLDNGAHLTYNQEFVDSAGLTTNSGNLARRTWIEL